MASEAIAVLEIGTHKIRVVVGEVREDGVVSIIGIGEAPSQDGIRKGEILNRDQALSDIRIALKAAEESLHRSIHSVHLITSGGETDSRPTSASLRLASAEENHYAEITPEDVEEVLELARRVALPQSRIRLHGFQQYFHLDDMSKIIDPVGLAGEELRVDMLTLHGKRSTVDNFQKMVEDIPIECSDAFFSALCSAQAILNDEQKKAGVLVIDLGAGTTDMVLYYDGIIQTAASFAVGGDHVANDIMVGLGISSAQAEHLKLHEGSALSNLLERDHNISIPAERGFSGKMVRAATLNTIINARMEELFTLVKDHIEERCPAASLGAGVLLTGGGAFLNGARDLGQKIFNAPCSLGKPLEVQGLQSIKDLPLYAAHIGAIRYATSIQEKNPDSSWKKRIQKFFFGDRHE
jgi:cell division protein FtsA